MTRYLISWQNDSHENLFEIVDSLALGFGSDPAIEALVEGWDKPRTDYFYKHQHWCPEFAYHATDRSDPDVCYIVYRENDARDLICAGAIRRELLNPWQPDRCTTCGRILPDEW
jgi:hypothetical protein